MHINLIFGAIIDAPGPCRASRASAASSHAPAAALPFSQRKVASCVIDMNLVELLQVLHFCRLLWLQTWFRLSSPSGESLSANSLTACGAGRLAAAFSGRAERSRHKRPQKVSTRSGVIDARVFPNARLSPRFRPHADDMFPHTIRSPRSARSHDKDRDSIRSMLSAFNR